MPLLFPGSLLGIAFAITSAVVWGSGDFSGGFATRRSTQYQVLAVSALSGMLILVICAAVWRETIASVQGLLWAFLGGVSGAIGIAALYRALSMGYTASVAPTAGVISAVLPVIFSMVTIGIPALPQLIGFVLAFIGIWFVSHPSTGQDNAPRRAFLLACLAGIGFGGFFILLAQVEDGKVFIPLVAARAAAFFTGLLLLWRFHQPLPSLGANPIALLAGVLDAGGNVFYLLAKQYTRLDVAAVLASLYPAATVLLASLLLKERISRSQGAGVVICLVAIALITV